MGPSDTQRACSVHGNEISYSIVRLDHIRSSTMLGHTYVRAMISYLPWGLLVYSECAHLPICV